MRGVLVVRLLLVLVALGGVGAAYALRDQSGIPLALLVLAAVLVWAVTRPWHPVVPALYRLRLRSAWEDWAEALERFYASDDPAATGEALRATDGLLLRVSTMKPPPAERSEHDRRVRGLADYADALRAWARARSAGDDAGASAAAARLSAARDALG